VLSLLVKGGEHNRLTIAGSRPSNTPVDSLVFSPWAPGTLTGGGRLLQCELAAWLGDRQGATEFRAAS
jgi:hypothetical protein